MTADERVPSVAGSWDLRSIDGKPLPVIRHRIDEVDYITVRELATFARDGSLTISIIQKTSLARTTSTSESRQAWEQTGNKVQFSGDSEPAILEGRVLTRVDYVGQVYVYERLA